MLYASKKSAQILAKASNKTEKKICTKITPKRSSLITVQLNLTVLMLNKSDIDSFGKHVHLFLFRVFTLQRSGNVRVPTNDYIQDHKR